MKINDNKKVLIWLIVIYLVAIILGILLFVFDIPVNLRTPMLIFIIVVIAIATALVKVAVHKNF